MPLSLSPLYLFPQIHPIESLSRKNNNYKQEPTFFGLTQTKTKKNKDQLFEYSKTSGTYPQSQRPSNMGIFNLKPTRLVPLLLLLVTLSAIIWPSSIAADDVVQYAAFDAGRGGGIGDIATGNGLFPSPPPPSPPPLPNGRPSFSPFRPGIAVMVAILTTMFSVTFLLLLYAKHCKRGSIVVSGQAPLPSAARKNSGIERTVIESLPVFRFRSLRGQKEGLECAVCLTRFDSAEVLRLLPKCKHAFHVECVDTWLDAHSTCPLCRYRVDPEDVLLVDDPKILPQNQPIPSPADDSVVADVESGRLCEVSNIRRISGRHSSAGERGTGFLQMILQRASDSGSQDLTSFRRSLDSAGSRKKSDSVAVGCFDRPRKDGLLLSDERTGLDRTRFEHRIIVSPGSGGFNQRWSDVQPSDLLYLRSEMIISNSRRLSSSASGSRPSMTRQHDSSIIGGNGWWGGRNVINARSVSEITGLSRFQNPSHQYEQQREEQEQRQAGVVSRWLAWISQTRPAVRSERTTATIAS
ncbi:hypothetical protein F2P56_025921 [Juglans regia]|uniref:RING-type E3 ubiquitin transferase n=2 Tax=Juglans regia TaxID=51240 RepID=A0A2I4GNJ4_JUGRE|nr:RING-H2 finger protein ATL43 [Juglans regia]KAF5456433.1 hypothetical protein F2P56_025921 [Juglans regia]